MQLKRKNILKSVLLLRITVRRRAGRRPCYASYFFFSLFGYFVTRGSQASNLERFLVNVVKRIIYFYVKYSGFFYFCNSFPHQHGNHFVWYSPMRRVSQVLERHFPRSLQRNNAFLWFSSAISLPWIVSFGGVASQRRPVTGATPHLGSSWILHSFFLVELWKTGLAPGVVGWEWWQLAIWLRCPCFCEDAVILHPFLLFYCNLILLCHLSFFLWLDAWRNFMLWSSAARVEFRRKIK